MAPSRKSTTANRRTSSRINEVSPNIYEENGNKRRQKKRKLSNLLGPQWSKEEVERFYEAYRRYGKDWKKVAMVVCNRSAEMVEALYSMNRAYLSLPEGTASVVGLVAMMTDHYSILGGSDSEQKSNEAAEAWKPEKRPRGKFQNNTSKRLDEHFQDVSQSHPVVSSNGCLSLLKKKRSGLVPHAVGKRTPRFPVSHSKDNRETNFSPAKLDLNLNMDDVAHKIAMALTEASNRSGSPQVSQTSSRKVEGALQSPLQDGRRLYAEPGISSAKLHHYGFRDDISLGSTKAGNDDYARENCNLMGRVENTVEFRHKGKKHSVKQLEVEDRVKDHLDGQRETFRVTEEHKLNALKGNLQNEAAANVKSVRAFFKDTKKRSRKSLFTRDEDSAFEALQTLADLSLMMPNTFTDTGYHSEPDAEDKCDKSSKVGKARAGIHESSARMQKSKQKSPFKAKIHKDEAQTDSHSCDILKIEATGKEKRSVCKGKRSPHNSAHPPGKVVKPVELTSLDANGKKEESNSVFSTVELPSANKFNLPKKGRSRRTISTPKPLTRKDTEFPETVSDAQHNIHVPSFRNRVPTLKEKLSNCLSWYQARRLCAFEWFYSSIDYPWFAKMDFVEFLNHVGLGHVQRLTKVEWEVLKSSLGKPRRFSEHFLKVEREKLNQYRESVRTHYAELRAGRKEGLPIDLAPPLSVGQHVIAIHPKTREIHNGSVLTVEHSRCRVQFDQPDLGVEFVSDIECMPSNLLESMPASFARPNSVESLKELKKEGKTDEYGKFYPSQSLCNTDSHYISPSTRDIGKLVKHTKAAEADVQALTELTRALDKKETVTFALKCMNDEVWESKKDGKNSLKDSESFKKQYAAVLLQLNEANEKVTSALCFLRQRNTYEKCSPPIMLRPMASVNDPCFHSSDYIDHHAEEYRSQVAEMVESSIIEAQKMVGAAEQAMSALEKNGNKRTEEAMDFINNKLRDDDLSMPAATRSFTGTDSVFASPDQLIAGQTTPLVTGLPDPTLNGLSNQNDQKFPSELIARCVATLLMIQKCTERQFALADIAQVLDSALTSLRPRSPQNLSIYEEIQKLMGIIRSQILAIIPT
ncbi:hypothetical protein UlMin_009531 [Ulmus minor]